jgi:hypothetical protein
MAARAASFDRRSFLLGTAAAGASWLAAPATVRAAQDAAEVRRAYRGPNVVLIRWGGGTRRRESIDREHTYAPYLAHELVPRGVLFPKVEMSQLDGLNTSHGEGTLNLLTGKYDRYRDVGLDRPDAGFKFMGTRFEAKVPTLFEYLRATFDVADHQALIINGEDRADEEFYNFSNHHSFGVKFRSETLSLRRFKAWLLKRDLAAGKWDEKEAREKQKELAEFEALDYRVAKEIGQGDVIGGFWDKWRDHWGESGLVNPRGDRLLTELALWSLRELRPRLLMVNYQDTDYVHWGYVDHYTRAMSIMDEGLRAIVAAVESDPEYRENTVFIVVPDCGRDDNPFMDVPMQHHFNSRSAHEIFALAFGAGVARGKVIDRVADQTSIASTVARTMGFEAPFAEAPFLEEVFA